MKQKLSILILLVGGALAAQVSIRLGPPPAPRVATVRPASPGQDFAWIDGYWYPVGNRYTWHDSYWTRTPYQGARWVEPRYDGERFYQGFWDGDAGRYDHDHRWDRNNDRDYDRGPGRGRGRGRGRGHER